MAGSSAQKYDLLIVGLMSEQRKVIGVAGGRYIGAGERLILKWFIHAHVLSIQLLKAQRAASGAEVTLTGTLGPRHSPRGDSKPV